MFFQTPHITGASGMYLGRQRNAVAQYIPRIVVLEMSFTKL
jgi:hypothetical protein